MNLDNTFVKGGNGGITDDDAVTLSSIASEAMAPGSVGRVKTAAAVDRTWLHKPETVDFEALDIHKTNNVKKELEIQWALGNLEPSYSDEEYSGEVERNLDGAGQIDGHKVIKFARNMMNSGKMGNRLAGSMKSAFTVREMEACRSELEPVLALDGIIGTVAVDATGYRSCSEAMKVASGSPYKHHLHYIIGCGCNHKVSAYETVSGDALQDNLRPTDAFLASEGERKTVRSVQRCPVTGLIVAANSDGIDDEFIRDTLIDVESLAKVGSEKARISRVASGGPSIASLGAAFRILDREAAVAKAEKYACPVDSVDFGLKQDSGFLGLDSVPSEFDVDGDSNDYGLGDISGIDALPPIELNPYMDVDEEFAGGDIIPVDDISAPAPQLDIDMKFDDIGE